jgi:hypothetical protein
MKKLIYSLFAVLIFSSLSVAQMKLRLPAEITGETSQSLLNQNLESNLQLQVPSDVLAPAGDEFLKMWFLGLMADATFPMGDFGEAWSTGFSGHAVIGYMIAKSMLLNLSIGYTTFSEKESIEGEDVSYSWIPLLLGLNYVFNPGQKFMPFIGLAVALYFISYSYSYEYFGQSFSGDSNSTEFGVVPRIGAYYMASAALLIALSAEYNLIFTEGSTTTALGVLLGFMYALR